jgi:predicted nucleotidyltransferase
MDYQPYIDRLKREKANARQQLAAKRRRALQAAKKLATLLKKDFGVERVFLFGSCLHEEYFHQRSDIDLGVEGLHWEDSFKALFEVNTQGHGFEVDLIELETCDAFLRKKILAEGKEL